MANPSANDSPSSPNILELIELLNAAKRAFDTAMACNLPDIATARRAERQIEGYFIVARQRLHESAARSQRTDILEAAKRAEQLFPQMSAVYHLIGLLTFASSTKPGRSRGSKTGSDPDLKALKFQIKKLFDEGCTHEQICDRIAGCPRPPGVRWRHIDWPQAFRSERYRDAAKSWLSRTIHQLDN